DGRERAHRHGPGSLHHHLGGQHARAMDRLASRRVLGSERMSATVTTSDAAAAGTELKESASSPLTAVSRRRRFVDRAMTALIGAAFAAAIVPLVWLMTT